jgi:nitrate/nitrite-specific signal transduction histidine kinase
MRARAVAVGGDLVLESAPGGGTRIIVEVARRETHDADAGQLGDE